MKTLFPKQEEAFDFFVYRQTGDQNTLDQSDPGTGKTVVAVKMAKKLGRPIAIICPKAVIPASRK